MSNNSDFQPYVVEDDLEELDGVFVPKDPSEYDAEAEDASLDGDASRRGRHAKEEEIPEYMQHSRRMRKILIVVIVLLVVLLIASGVLAYMLFDTARTAATQQAQNTMQDISSINTDQAKDAASTTTKTTTPPNLTELFDLNAEEAIERIQHGAQITSITEVKEEGNPIRTQIRVALTAEPSDAKSGTPTVYLNFNEEGVVIQSGYSAATSQLGYGSISFSDMIANEHIIEKTLAECGLTVDVGSVQVPADKTTYSTYASDGKALTREYCTFEGTGNANGNMHDWSAALSYDYTLANATGNLADTIRTVYVYINTVGFDELPTVPVQP